MFVPQRQPSVDTLRERTCDITSRVHLIEAPIGQIDTRGETVFRLRRHIVHRACGGVLTEQSPLRPLEHFHSLDIHWYALGHSRVRQRYLVLINGYRRSYRSLFAVKANAPDREHGGSVLALSIGESRDYLFEVGRTIDPEETQLVAGCRRHGQGHVSQALVSLLGRDHDFAQLICARRRAGGRSVRRRPCVGKRLIDAEDEHRNGNQRECNPPSNRHCRIPPGNSTR